MISMELVSFTETAIKKIKSIKQRMVNNNGVDRKL